VRTEQVQLNANLKYNAYKDLIKMMYSEDSGQIYLNGHVFKLDMFPTTKSEQKI